MMRIALNVFGRFSRKKSYINFTVGLKRVRYVFFNVFRKERGCDNA